MTLDQRCAGISVYHCILRNFHYDKVNPRVMDLNKLYHNMARKYHGWHVDYRYMVPANLSYLNKQHHVGKLVSAFLCNERPVKLLVLLLSHPSNRR